MLKLPTEFLLQQIGVDAILASLIAGTIPVSIITAVSIWFIWTKKYIRNLIDFGAYSKTKKILFIIGPILLFSVISINSYNNLPDLSGVLKVLFLIKYSLAGISEELVFRVIILGYFLRLLNGRKIQAVLISSLLFGLMHFINYFKLWDFDLVASQVIFAFAMGCFFAGLFLKTENIFAVAFLHILFNLGFTNHEELIPVQDAFTELEQARTIGSDIIGWIIFSSLILVGLLLSKSAKASFVNQTMN